MDSGSRKLLLDLQSPRPKAGDFVSGELKTLHHPNPRLDMPSFHQWNEKNPQAHGSFDSPSRSSAWETRFAESVSLNEA